MIFLMSDRRIRLIGRDTLRPKSMIVWCILALIVWVVSSVAHANQVGRPLVLVPGIVGSVLAEGNDIVWGDSGSLNASNFKKLDLLPPTGTPVQLEAVDALRNIPVLFGAFKVGVYSNLIDFLVQELGYVEGKDLFVFSYDWRRTNFASAKHLSDFIARNVGNQEYDIIAHSMGGIVSRIMLVGGQRQGLCETGKPSVDFPEPVGPETLQTLCSAIYGPGPDKWPSAMFSGPYLPAAKLHTYIEMAVPHFGSNDVVSTYIDGWGRLTDILTGGTDTVQSVLLSMASPMELAPVYKNCCAKGRAGHGGNIPYQGLEQVLEFDRWSEKILNFGISPCPYPRCTIRKHLLAEAIAARKVIDDILNQEVPSSVRQIHVFMGTEVKGTNIVHYIANDAKGAGDGISFLANSDGDGTVPFVSAKPPETYPTRNIQEHVAARVSHPFIFESKALKDQLHYAILNPDHGAPIQVASDSVSIGGSTLSSSSLTLRPQVAFAGDVIHASLKMVLTVPINEKQLANETYFAKVRVAGSEKSGSPVALVFDKANTLLSFGEVTLTGNFTAPIEPGVYLVEASLQDKGGDTIIEKTLFSIIDKE